jgi:hypothetical protein
VRDGGLDYCALSVKTQGPLTIVRVFKLAATGISLVLKFTFINEKGEVEEDSEYFEDNKSEESGPIFTLEDIQTSTVDALRRYYGSQAIEQALRIFEEQKHRILVATDEEYEAPNIFEKMENEQPSVHRTRMISNYLQSLDTRTVTLHRKKFYDDQSEKLLIMYVQLRYV